MHNKKQNQKIPSSLTIGLIILFVGLIFFTVRDRVVSAQAQSTTCNVKNYGAKGDGSTDDTSGIQSAISSCGSYANSVVLFPQGTYMVSDRLNLYDGMMFKLDNATIKGMDTFSDHRLIYADQVDNISIEGPGTIERGRGGVYIYEPENNKDEYWLHTVVFDMVNNINIKDITITSEAYYKHPLDDKPLRGYHLQTWKCSNVTYENVIVKGNISGGSNDAFHISEGYDDITILGGEGWSGDDPLVFHGPGDFNNININGTELGGKTRGAILMTTYENSNTNMHFENIKITRAVSGSKGAGIAVLPRGPNVKYNNITFNNIIMDGDIQIPFNAINPCDYCGSVDLTGLDARNIVFSNIDVHQENNDYYNNSRISEITRINDIRFENITYHFSSWQQIPNTLIKFSQISGLCIYNFKIIKGGSEVPNPLSYLDWSDNVTNLSTNHPCGSLARTFLSISKTANRTITFSGDIILYTLNYRNNSSGQLKNIIITDPVPPWTLYVPGSADHNGQYSNNQIIWDLGTMPAGTSGNINFSVKIK